MKRGKVFFFFFCGGGGREKGGGCLLSFSSSTIFFFSVKYFLPRQMWPYCSVTYSQEVAAASNWRASVLVSGVKWLALLPHCFLLSLHLRKITGRRQRLIIFFFFCSICMSLQSDSLPSASFDHKTALGKKKISGWAFKAWRGPWELRIPLAQCCTSQI